MVPIILAQISCSLLLLLLIVIVIVIIIIVVVAVVVVCFVCYTLFATPFLAHLAPAATILWQIVADCGRLGDLGERVKKRFMKNGFATFFLRRALHRSS